MLKLRKFCQILRLPKIKNYLKEELTKKLKILLLHVHLKVKFLYKWNPHIGYETNQKFSHYYLEAYDKWLNNAYVLKSVETS